MSHLPSPSSDPFNPFGLLQEPSKESSSERMLLSRNNDVKSTQGRNDVNNNNLSSPHRFLSLESPPLSSTTGDGSSQMQPRPRATFLDGTFVVHPGQEDPTNAIIPPSDTQQVHRLVDNPQHCPNHGWSCGDAHNALRRSRSSSSSFSFNQRDTKLTTSNTNPSVVKVPLSHYKTEYCTKFRELGQCPFGERCQFVHHDSELQRKERALTYKTRPCWSGTSCQYQMNHSRCVYLHGDETAEMFDEQRGISFARVKKILAAKEVKQQHRRQQQQQQQAQTQEQCRFSLLEQSSSTESLEAASSQEGGQELESEGRAAELKESTIDEPLGTPAAVFVPHQQKTLQRSFSYPLSTPKRTLLTIVPPSLQFLLNNDKNNDSAMGSITTATTHPLADLFSPGEMPFIETPFPSHDRINEWKDPCFDEEDSEDNGVDGVGTVIRATSSSLHRPPVSVPPLSSSAPMLGSLGMMVFYSDTIPADPSVTTYNQLALDLHRHLQAQNHTQQDAVASNSLVHMMDVFSFKPS